LEGLPDAHRSQARSALAASLVSVVYQQLMPGSSGQRVAAFEVLKATPAVRNLIREDKPAQLHSVMQTGRQQGMQTIEQAVHELTYAGVLAEPQCKGLLSS
jgi:twitching motility protein PilT